VTHSDEEIRNIHEMETFTAVEHYTVVFWALHCVVQMVINNVVQEHATSIFRSWWKQEVPPKWWYLSMTLHHYMTMTLILTKPSILCNYFCCIFWQVFKSLFIEPSLRYVK
jgi:hypothetical protein